MKLTYACCAALTIALAGCATGTPSTLTVRDPQNRHIDNKIAMTDEGTARRCADNMINASPANEAINVTTRTVGTGDNIVVDVGATLLMQGTFAQTLPVTYRCTYSNGLMTLGTWTSGLKGS